MSYCSRVYSSLLFAAVVLLGSGSTAELFLVYSDGSGVESYRCDHGPARWGGRQLASGDVVFTHGASLARSSTNVRWIFRLPGQTTSIDAVRLAVAALQKSGGDAEKVRDLLASGEVTAGFAFLSNGDPSDIRESVSLDHRQGHER